MVCPSPSINSYYHSKICFAIFFFLTHQPHNATAAAAAAKLRQSCPTL